MDVEKALEIEALALRRAWLDGPYGSPSADALADARLSSLVERAQVQARHAGEGSALKPAHEPIVVARKPLVGTVAANVLAHGTGAINVDGCRVGFSGVADESESKGKNRRADFGSGARDNKVYGEDLRARGEHGNYDAPGRWPANVVLSHAEGCVLVDRRTARSNGHFPAARGASGYGSAVEGSTGGGLKGQDGLEERRFDGELADVWACVPGCPVRMLDDQTGDLRTPGATSSRGRAGMYGPDGRGERIALYGDSGGASRFFLTTQRHKIEECEPALTGELGLRFRYCAKASRAEREAGLPEGLEARHPTVKPIELMRWLVRLVTPPGGLVLDPFVGSGSTGCAAVLEGFRFVGVERDREYVAIARARIEFWAAQPAGLSVKAALRGGRRPARELGQIGLDF